MYCVCVYRYHPALPLGPWPIVGVVSFSELEKHFRRNTKHNRTLEYNTDGSFLSWQRTVCCVGRGAWISPSSLGPAAVREHVIPSVLQWMNSYRSLITALNGASRAMFAKCTLFHAGLVYVTSASQQLRRRVTVVGFAFLGRYFSLFFRKVSDRLLCRTSWTIRHAITRQYKKTN